MRLVELDPRWIGYDGYRLGMSFKCPHCREQRLAVAFHHRGLELMEDAHIRPTHPDGYIWTAEGDTFETITLTPSVDASNSGHWHGHITSGMIQ